jgi:Protein of unknown function (DUF2934)
MAHHNPHFSLQAWNPKGQLSAASVKRIDVKSASDEDIAKRAYEKYEARGRAHGFDLEDWTAASHELIAETFGHLTLLSPSLSPSLSPIQHAT